MRGIEALHTAARRYAIDRAGEWSRRYSELLAREERARRDAGVPEPATYGYSDEALATFPRYNVLHAIQAAIERLAPADFESIEDAREQLASAGQTAENPFTRPPHGDMERRAIDEERVLFAESVRRVGEDELARVEPLPFQRTLSLEETSRLWHELRTRWGIEDYWYPLDRPPDAEPPSHAVAFAAGPFHTADVQQRLRDALAHLGVGRLWEVREGDADPDLEIDLESLEPIYTGAEGYWMDASFEWLVYASHESSVTIAGTRLLPAFEQAWPDSAAHLYTGA